MSAKNNNINNLIDNYVSGAFNQQQTDELWAELIGDGDAMEYLQTVSAMKKMAKDEVFDNLQLFENTEADYQDKVLASDDGTKHDAAEEAPGSEQFVRQGWSWVAAAILMIMAAAGVGYVMLQQDQNDQTEPIAAIEYDIFRSVGDNVVGQMGMEDVILLSASGKHSEAIRLLNELRPEIGDESAVRINVLEASLHYNSGNYEEAAAHFSAIELDLLSPRESEKVLWFTANAKLQTGQEPEARILLNQIIEIDGSYSRVARNLLNRIKD